MNVCHECKVHRSYQTSAKRQSIKFTINCRKITRSQVCTTQMGAYLHGDRYWETGQIKFIRNYCQHSSKWFNVHLYLWILLSADDRPWKRKEGDWHWHTHTHAVDTCRQHVRIVVCGCWKCFVFYFHLNCLRYNLMPHCSSHSFVVIVFRIKCNKRQRFHSDSCLTTSMSVCINVATSVETLEIEVLKHWFRKWEPKGKQWYEDRHSEEMFFVHRLPFL